MSALQEASVQGWTQVGELGVAFVLSAIIGLERELKQKSAGIRTYTVVGLGAALFTLVGKYGFNDVLTADRITLDPSRVTAQIVSGLGFIGAGIIFVRRGSVVGLTTAASVWLTAAVGAAAGAGLLILATLTTAAYFVAILVLPLAARVLQRWTGGPRPSLRVHYAEGRGLLRDVLQLVTQSGFSISDVASSHHERGDDQPPRAGLARTQEQSAAWVEVRIQLTGRGDLQGLLAELSDLSGVLEVTTADEMEP